jgi:hypothetical protein
MKIIVVNNTKLEASNFEAAVIIMSVLARPHGNFDFESCSDLNYLGQNLKNASGEVFVVPVGFQSFEKLMQVRNTAIANGHSLMLSKLGHPTGSNEFYHLTANDFVAYFNCNILPDNCQLDFGPVCTIDEIYINESTTNSAGVISCTSELVKRSNVKFETGWILIKMFLEAGATVADCSGIVNGTAIVDYNDYSLVTDLIIGKFNSKLGCTEEEFNVAAELLRTPMAVPVAGYSSSVVTAYDNVSTPLENFYCPAAVGSFSLLKNYTITSDTRLIFFDKDDSAFNKIRTVLELWNGSNENTLSLTTSEQLELTEMRAGFVNDFDSFWTTCRSIYKQWYTFSDLALVDDVESQCHVNNVVVVADGFNSLLLNLIKSKRLYSTEILYIKDGKFSTEKIGTEVYKHRHYSGFRITFRNTQTGQLQPLDYKIQDFFTAQKWARCMHQDYMLHDSVIAEKNYMLQQWEYDESNPNARSIPVLCSEMNRYIKVINDYFDGSSSRRVDYHITQYFDPATLDQQILNEIHHHFELLIGQVWCVSEYFKLADSATCFAIRQLNNLCHEMEYLRRPSLASQVGTRNAWHAGIYFPFIPTIRYKFVECDYDHFTQFLEYGDLVLHYAQLGKTPMEAYGCRDEEVFDDNITGLRYLSGEFDVIFKREIPKAQALAKIEHDNIAAFEWIRARGQDPTSKFTGIGLVPIAKVDRSKWPGQTAEQIQLELYKYDDIYKLELLDSNDNVIESLTLDYTWRDVLSKTDPTRQ